MSNAPQTLTVMESNRLLDELLRDTGTIKQKALGIRNYLMGLLMLDAGLRVGEVVKQQVDSLYFAAEPVQTLVLTKRMAKNHTPRTVPTSQRIRHAIESMNNHIWQKSPCDNCNVAFRNISTHQPITTRQVERIIRKASLASIGRPVHPHVLRHTFASRLMRTVNIRIVQELLGHKSISSTQIYTHPNQEDLKKAIGSLEKNPDES